MDFGLKLKIFGAFGRSIHWQSIAGVRGCRIIGSRFFSSICKAWKVIMEGIGQWDYFLTNRIKYKIIDHSLIWLDMAVTAKRVTALHANRWNLMVNNGFVRFSFEKDLEIMTLKSRLPVPLLHFLVPMWSYFKLRIRILWRPMDGHTAIFIFRCLW